MKFKPSHKRWATLPVITLLFFLFIFLSCKKDDPVGVNAGGNGVISMKIDGVQWTSKDEIDGAIALESQGSLTINGYHTDGSNIGMSLPTPNQGSTWSFSGGGAASYKLDINDTGWISSGGTGDFSITFSTYNESKAKGTFGGTLVQFDAMGNSQEIVISDASFDLNF